MSVHPLTNALCDMCTTESGEWKCLSCGAQQTTRRPQSAYVYSARSSARSFKCEHACRITLLAGDPGKRCKRCTPQETIYSSPGRSSNHSRIVAVLMKEISGKLALRYALPLFCKRSSTKRKLNSTSKRMYFHTHECLPPTWISPCCGLSPML